MSNIATKDDYHRAFVTIGGKNYKCLGLVESMPDTGQFTFIGESTHSMGYIERVSGANWGETEELPKDLVCRNWVRTTHFDNE